MSARPAAVAGAFYPSEAEALAATVATLLENAPAPTPVRTAQRPPKAMILPHAGYAYSGPVAATGYRLLAPAAERIRRVILLGPAHRVHLSGMALPSVDRFEVPTGSVMLDRALIETLEDLPGTRIDDEAHALEHCLEVQLPFLQAVLDRFELVPIVVGQCPASQVAGLLEAAWGGEETVIIVSSDLSHYHTHETARDMDASTTARIIARSSDLEGEEACGATAINGLMLAARGHDLSVHVLDIRTSGDTAGDHRQVVGYGAYALS